MSDQPNTVSTSGYLPNGRRIYVTAKPGDDVDALVALAIELDGKMAAHGLTVREQGVEAGEQVQTIRYLLRRKQTNDDGSFTPIIDLYSQSFRWTAIYLNDISEVETFERACGIKLDKMPLSLSQIKEYSANDPDIASLFTVLQKPIEIIWQDNPKYEGPEDKKHLKRSFVRWHSVAPATNGKSAPPPPSVPQQPQPSTNGAHDATKIEGGKPATPKGSERLKSSLDKPAPHSDELLPPEDDYPVLRSNWVIPHETKDKTVYYEVEGGATTYSRELFRKVGYSEQDLATWPIEIGRKIMLLSPLDVFYKNVTSNGRDFKQIVRIEKIEQEAF